MNNTRLDLVVLLHTKPGIEKTIRLLKETGIGTRSWHLARVQDDELREEEREDELALG